MILPGVLPTGEKIFISVISPVILMFCLYLFHSDYLALLGIFALIQSYGILAHVKGKSFFPYKKYMDNKIGIARQTGYGISSEMMAQWQKFMSEYEKCPKCGTEHIRGLFLLESDIYGVVGVHNLSNTLFTCSKCTWKVSFR